MENLINTNTTFIANIEQYIIKYLEYLDVSENTIKEYSSGLKHFFNYCNDNDIKEIKREHIITYREDLKLDGKEPNTINLYLASVKSFFKWLEYEGIYKDITRNVKSFKIERHHTRDAFTIDEIKTILNSCKNIREKAIVLLAVNCGLRCNEICNIRKQDFKIKQDKTCLYVLGKARQGLKSDFVIVDDRTFQSIKDYIEEFKIKDYLFTSTSNNNRTGEPISPRGMRKIFNKILERCELKDKFHTFHSCRHSNATIAIQNGVDIRQVSQNLRHKNIQTSMIYLHDLDILQNKCSNVVSNLIF